MWHPNACGVRLGVRGLGQGGLTKGGGGLRDSPTTPENQYVAVRFWARGANSFVKMCRQAPCSSSIT